MGWVLGLGQGHAPREVKGMGWVLGLGQRNTLGGGGGLGSGTWAGEGYFVLGLFAQMLCICAVIVANKCLNGV